MDGMIQVITEAKPDGPLPSNGWMDTASAAAYLRVTRATVSRWCGDGTIADVRRVDSPGRAGWSFLIPTREVARIRRGRRRQRAS